MSFWVLNGGEKTKVTLRLLLKEKLEGDMESKNGGE